MESSMFQAEQRGLWAFPHPIVKPFCVSVCRMGNQKWSEVSWVGSLFQNIVSFTLRVPAVSHSLHLYVPLKVLGFYHFVWSGLYYPSGGFVTDTDVMSGRLAQVSGCCLSESDGKALCRVIMDECRGALSIIVCHTCDYIKDVNWSSQVIEKANSFQGSSLPLHQGCDGGCG